VTGSGQQQQVSPHPAGVILVDKPYRLSSTSIVRVVKRRVKNGLVGTGVRPKVGHAGTLDPLASGLLVVLVGKATKLCDLLMAGEKEYTAEVDLSVVSPTDDLEAQTTPVPVERPPTRAEVDGAVARFIGTIEQMPPAHSAMKIGGKPAYALARKGRDPGLKARPVVIRAITVLRYEWPRVELDITCGKGTYIRSLARDLGTALGTGGCLTALRRTRVGEFRVDGAWQLDDVPDPLRQEHLVWPAAAAPAEAPPENAA
jgi:tRNA pseudouridine55 synthase